jgi:iron complex outermembrane recepter protein
MTAGATSTATQAAPPVRELEVGLELRPAQQWNLRAAATLNDFRFREYTVDGESFRGNRLPSLPRQQLFLEAAWSDGPVFAILDALYVGSRYADDANDVKVDSQTTVNARIGRHWDHGRLRAEGFLAVNNLFDTDAIDNIRINAGFGRYFEPAPDRNFLVGLRIYHRP